MAGLNNSRSYTALFCLLFIAFTSISMRQNPDDEPRKKTKIEMKSNLTSFQKEVNPDVYVLEGDVVFIHEGAYMYCDSAYLYNLSNSLEAFNDVFIEQGDTIFIYGDYLHYDGNISLVKMRDNVRMEHYSSTLYTDNFNYDRIADIAYFFDGGELVDSLNTLTSVYGQYSPETKVANFYNIVELINPQFTLTTDTLSYNTVTKIASITSPSVIKGDSGVIYSSKGFYETITQRATLLNRSVVLSKDRSRTITADSLIYDRLQGFGEGFGYMVVNDTARKAILEGNYGFYNELTGFTFATDSAQFIEYSQQDSLFVHADTLLMLTLESGERELKAYHGVRFYRQDIQGVCDSMQYNTIDRTLNMYGNPILWNNNYQITGDTIRVLFNEETIEQFEVLNSVFAVEHVEELYFNQIKGRNLITHFREGEAFRVDVNGNVEFIYYPIEKGGGFVGQNTTQTSFMEIDIEEREPVRIKCYPYTEGEVTPIPDLTPEKKYLKGFVNYDYVRPLSPADIFRPTVFKVEDIPVPKRSRQRQ